MIEDVLTLITEVPKDTSTGDRVMVEERTDVFVQEMGVGASYKLQALAVGLRPKYRVKLAEAEDYAGQEVAEYQGERLRIIDTRRRSDHGLELTLEGLA